MFEDGYDPKPQERTAKQSEGLQRPPQNECAPFGVFIEWSSAADEKAYRDL
jgi:hypothetical protein